VTYEQKLRLATMYKTIEQTEGSPTFLQPYTNWNNQSG